MDNKINYSVVSYKICTFKKFTDERKDIQKIYFYFVINIYKEDFMKSYLKIKLKRGRSSTFH